MKGKLLLCGQVIHVYTRLLSAFEILYFIKELLKSIETFRISKLAEGGLFKILGEEEH